jgi:hypothetical protein
MKINVNARKFFAFLLAAMVFTTPVLAGAQFNPSEFQDEAANFGMATDTNVTDIATKIIKFALLVMMFLAVGAFIVAGIVYITAGGSSRADSARQIITYSIVGLIVGLLGYVIVSTVQNILDTSTN